MTARRLDTTTTTTTEESIMNDDATIELEAPPVHPITNLRIEIRNALDAGDFRRVVGLAGSLPALAPGERWTEPEVPVDFSGVPERFRFRAKVST